MRIPEKELMARVEQGLIKVVEHPTLPLKLWNYTDACVYKHRNWDYYTLSARGLVTDGDEVVSLPFQKFFNAGEVPETMESSLPDLPYEATKKRDGSMIQVYGYRDKVMIHTRGAWANEQTEVAARIVKDSFDLGVVENLCLQQRMTLLHEVEYPGNGTVVAREHALPLIGARNNVTSEDHFHKHLTKIAAVLKCPVVELYDGMELNAIFAYNEPGSEGFVVRYTNGMRMKVKTMWFRSMFRVRNFWSPVRIIEMLEKNEKLDLDQVDYTEDERNVVNEYIEQFTIEFNKVKDAAARYVAKAEGTRKEKAAFFNKHCQPITMAVCFALLDGKPYDHIIWKGLKQGLKDKEEDTDVWTG